jgi:hypothetical protein
LGDEPSQYLRRLEDVTEDQLQKVQEEKEKATKALKKEKEEVLEQLRVAQYCVTTYENEKEEFWVILQEDKVKIPRENEQLLAKLATVKEEVNRACLFIPSLAQEEHESLKVQVTKLIETI